MMHLLSSSYNKNARTQVGTLDSCIKYIHSTVQTTQTQCKNIHTRAKKKQFQNCSGHSINLIRTLKPMHKNRGGPTWFIPILTTNTSAYFQESSCSHQSPDSVHSLVQY